MLNEHEIEQPKLRELERLTEGNDHDKNETQSNIIEELIEIETEENALNESTSHPVTSEELNETIESNQNEILKKQELKLNLVLIA